MKLILTDMDQCLVKWAEGFQEYLKTDFGLVPSEKIEDVYNVEEWCKAKFGIERDDARKMMNDFNHHDEYFRDLEPYPDAVKYVNKLHHEGYRFHVITACASNDETLERRRHNLEKYWPGVFEAVHCVGFAGQKKPLLSAYQPTYWVEDTWRHALAGLEAGHKPIILTRTHNQNMNHDGIKRVDHWGNIYDIIKS